MKYPAYPSLMTWNEELDATGLLCPLPVLKARKRLMAMEDGAILRMLADDPAAIIDVPHYCAESGHEFIKSAQKNDAQVYFIRKKSQN